MKPMRSIRLITDQAIAELNNTRQDALGFSSYADIIARIVQGTRGPFTIGIFGEWGMGKTSLMKMVEAEVQASPSKDHIVVPVWFNAWMFENVEYPVVPLIKSITQALKSRRDFLEKTDQAAAGLVIALESLVDALTLKAKLGVPEAAGAEATFSPGRFKESFRRIKNTRAHGIAQADPYENMFDALRSISDRTVPRNLTILVLIDDLDRCFPENAVRLLEGIKLVLSQPGFIFILGASRVVVEEYLQHKYQNQYGIAHFDGRGYLDKMIQLSFDIPPHTNRIDDFTTHIIADLGDKAMAKDLAPIASVIGRVCHYNPRAIIRFINRLVTDSAIYRLNSPNAKSAMPVGIFAITRSLQHSWRDFYGLVVGGNTSEDREYCDIVSGWSPEDITMWLAYDSNATQQNERVTQQMDELQNGEPAVLKQIAEQLHADRVLRVLMSEKIGKQWLHSHELREMSISFLTTQTGVNDVSAGEGGTSYASTDSSDDQLYRRAVQVVIEGRKASTSLLQRRLRIGYGRSARLIEQMEEEGAIGPADGARPREVLVNSVEEALRNRAWPDSFGAGPVEPGTSVGMS
jgi:hypothetical protein